MTDRECEAAIRLTVGAGMADHRGIHRSEDFGVNVGVEQGLTHPAGALTSVSRVLA